MGKGREKGGVANNGGSIRIWRRCERGSGNLIKIGSRGDEELGIVTGGSQTPEKWEAPRIQQD